MGDAHRILVVDDELGPREALRMILKAKYQVHDGGQWAGCASGVEQHPTRDRSARHQNARDEWYRGLETIKEADASIEVIMMTAHASLQTAREAMAHGASEYLIKPFSKKEVEEAIAKALKRQRERHRAQQVSVRYWTSFAP